MSVVFKNGNVVDVFCGEIVKADVLVDSDKIIGLGCYHAEKEIDVTNKYIIPGLIDAHLHIESSMVTPDRYSELIVPKGITTIIADPHEIANVCGCDGIDFMIESAKQVPLKIKFMAPSCVPATQFECNGAIISAKDLKQLLDRQQIIGLGEVMNFPGVIAQNTEVMQKLSVCDLVDGHAPLLTGQDLDKYLIHGIKTDHECSQIREMKEKIQKGMYILIREGSLEKNLATLIVGVNSKTVRRCCFCSDDRTINDLLENGTINGCIKKAVACGLSAIDAIIMSTINAAECYGLSYHGAIAPGYFADFLISSDLLAQNVESVYINGKIVANNGRYLTKIPQKVKASFLPRVTKTVLLPNLDYATLNIELKKDMPIIQLQNGSIFTKKIAATPVELNKRLFDETGAMLSRVAVIERYGKTGNVGLGIVKNYDINNGAIASTIGHDSHNVTVIGDNIPDMLLAANSLNIDGGISVVSNGRLTAKLSLPIAGLMSDLAPEEIYRMYQTLTEKAKKLAVNPKINAFMSLAFLPLTVIPEIRITCTGLFDMTNRRT